MIGVAFDGTGYGTDGTIWGGEFLIAGLAGFERAGHLTPVPMPGGAAAIRQPWRMAAAYLDARLPGAAAATRPARRPGGPVGQRNERQWASVVAMARRGINSPLTSSAGRLFDAVAAVLGVRDSVSYEGQAAAELEQLADPAEDGAYQASIDSGDVLQVAGADLVRCAADDLAAGVDRGVIAARFHNGLAGAIADCCLMLRERTGLTTVALSGGVFQNFRLLNTVTGQLEGHGFTVLTHSRVPCNDGGISLGQAVVAAARINHPHTSVATPASRPQPRNLANLANLRPPSAARPRRYNSGGPPPLLFQQQRPIAVADAGRVGGGRGRGGLGRGRGRGGLGRGRGRGSRGRGRGRGGMGRGGGGRERGGRAGREAGRAGDEAERGGAGRPG